MKEHSEDICECGDYRKQHPDNGVCNLNGLGHGMSFSEGKCEKFRLAYSREANYEIYDEPWESDRDRDSDECVFGADCLMPGDHLSSECHNVAMAEAWADEAALNS